MFGILCRSGIPNARTAEMRACYVNHHIVSRGRDAAAAGRAAGEYVAAGATSSSSPRLRRCTIKDDISRPIYITRERKSTSTSTHVWFIIRAYISVCARRPEAALRAPRLDIRSAERLFENERRSERSSKRPDRRLHYIGILSGVDRLASAGSDYHLGHFLSRTTIGD